MNLPVPPMDSVLRYFPAAASAQGDQLVDYMIEYHKLFDPYLGRQSLVAAADVALVVSDVQHMYCNQEIQEAKTLDVEAIEGAVENIRFLSELFDAFHLPRFMVYRLDHEDSTEAGGPRGWDGFYKQRLMGNFEIVAKHYDAALPLRWRTYEDYAVYDSPLLSRLREDYPHVKTLILCGFNTGACVFKTLAAAEQNGFKVIVVGDACANNDVGGRGNHERSLHIFANRENRDTKVLNTVQMRDWLQVRNTVSSRRISAIA